MMMMVVIMMMMMQLLLLVNRISIKGGQKNGEKAMKIIIIMLHEK